MLRSPVLVVTDPSFIQLYGHFRLTLKGFMVSLELFRRVFHVTVAESAGPDLITLAVEGSSRSPRAVLFPYRYLEGARLYKESHTEVPVLVVVGRSLAPQSSRARLSANRNSSQTQSITFIYTDAAQDLYRAGLCAVALTAEAKGVLFFSEETLSNECKEAFQEGLKAQGFIGNPVYLNTSAELASYSGIGCVVVAGPATKFIERDQKIPIILFSWLDPALTPRTVKLVFDDSPLALAVQALKSLPPPDSASAGDEIFVSSVTLALRDNIGEKKDFRKLQELIKEKFEKN